MPEVPILMLTAHFGVADEAAEEQGVLMESLQRITSRPSS